MLIFLTQPEPVYNINIMLIKKHAFQLKSSFRS